MGKFLLLIDCQNDFISGTLAVNGAKEIMDAAARYISKHGDEYDNILLTCDNHPFNHCSFKENGGEWPSHCVKHSVGAAIYEPIMEELKRFRSDEKGKGVAFFKKGCDKNIEEYSFLRNTSNERVFQTICEETNVEQIDILGILSEYCVLSSIKDLVRLGYKDKLFIMEDFCPSIDDGSTLHQYLEENNIKH